LPVVGGNGAVRLHSTKTGKTLMDLLQLSCPTRRGLSTIKCKKTSRVAGGHGHRWGDTPSRAPLTPKTEAFAMSPYFEGCDRHKAQQVVFDRRQRKRLPKTGLTFSESREFSRLCRSHSLRGLRRPDAHRQAVDAHSETRCTFHNRFGVVPSSRRSLLLWPLEFCGPSKRRKRESEQRRWIAPR